MTTITVNGEPRELDPPPSGTLLARVSPPGDEPVSPGGMVVERLTGRPPLRSGRAACKPQVNGSPVC